MLHVYTWLLYYVMLCYILCVNKTNFLVWRTNKDELMKYFFLSKTNGFIRFHYAVFSYTWHFIVMFVSLCAVCFSEQRCSITVIVSPWYAPPLIESFSRFIFIHVCIYVFYFQSLTTSSYTSGKSPITVQQTKLCAMFAPFELSTNYCATNDWSCCGKWMIEAMTIAIKIFQGQHC